MTKGTARVVAVIAVIVMVVAGLHLRARMTCLAGRSSVAALLGVPVAQVRPSDLLLLWPPRRLRVTSPCHGDIARATLRDGHVFVIAFPLGSPLQKWGATGLLGSGEAKETARRVAHDLLGSASADIVSSRQTLDTTGAPRGWTVWLHLQSDEGAPHDLVISMNETGRIHHVVFEETVRSRLDR